MLTATSAPRPTKTDSHFARVEPMSLARMNDLLDKCLENTDKMRRANEAMRFWVIWMAVWGVVAVMALLVLIAYTLPR